jgi:hypothetical protein
MDAHISNSHSRVCPICDRAGTVRSRRNITGFLNCQHCRERLVVSWSGHYVRDPFTCKPLSEQVLRRESRPLARIRRDLPSFASSFVLVVVGGAIFASTAFLLLQNVSLEPNSQSQEAIPTLKTNK